jgi:hypothetical protein
VPLSVPTSTVCASAIAEIEARATAATKLVDIFKGLPLILDAIRRVADGTAAEARNQSVTTLGNVSENTYSFGFSTRNFPLTSAR